jgi:hypothetical protein
MKVGSTIKNCLINKYFFVALFFADKISNELRPGAGGYVFVVEDVTMHEKFVLKSSCLEESKKTQFEKIISAWKNNILCKDVVSFKEFFYEGIKQCLF